MMRRNWDDVLMLLDVTHKLSGHPSLKSLRDEALEDLKDLSEQPAGYPPMPEAEPEESPPENPEQPTRRRI